VKYLSLLIVNSCNGKAAAQEIFLIIINVKNNCASYYLVGNMIFFSGFLDEQKAQKNSFYLK